MRRRDVPLALSAFALGALPARSSAQAPSAPLQDATQPNELAFPAFDQVARKIQADYPDVESVVVVRKRRVLFEHHRASPEALHDVQSVTKSVLSLAVGSALGRGALASLDQPVGELLGMAEQAKPGSSSRPVTVRHLLTMTAGFRTQERFALGTADDPAYLLGRERVEAPGTVFAYDNLSANLLSIALEVATGQSVASFAQQTIFRPLHITAFEWAKGAKGHALGFSGLRLRTRDMARLGELALGAGAWDGEQIIPQGYAQQAVAAQNIGGRPVGLSYGFLWWVVPSASERSTFLASGWGGQFIWVHPALDLVIATTSAVSAQAHQRGQALALIRKELFRAAQASPV